MAGPVADAFVELKPDFGSFDSELAAGIQRAIATVEAEAERGFAAVAASAENAAAASSAALAGIAADADLDSIGAEAEAAGDEVGGAFESGADQAGQALAGIPDSAEFDAVGAQASSAADEVGVAFESGADEAAGALESVARFEFGVLGAEAFSVADQIGSAFESGADQAGGALASIPDAANFDAAAAEAETAGDEIGTAFESGADRASDAIAGLATALAAVGVGFSLGNAVNEIEKAETAVAIADRVIFTIGRTGETTGREIEQMADRIALAAGTSGAELQTAANILLTFANIGSDSLEEILGLATDMAAVFGTDLRGASVQLGKALNDPIRGLQALSRVGVTFTETQRQVITSLVETGDVVGAQRVILDEMAKQFGGTAVASATASAQIAEAFGQAFDEIGRGIADVLDASGPQLIELIQSLGPLFVTLGELTGSFVSILVASTPVIEAFASVMAAIPSEVLAGVAAMLTISTVLRVLPGLFTAVRTRAVATGLAIGALNPAVAAIAVAVGVLTLGLADNAQKAAENQAAINEMAAAMRAAETPVQGLTDSLTQTVGESEFLRTALADADVTLGELSDALLGPVSGFESLRDEILEGARAAGFSDAAINLLGGALDGLRDGAGSAAEANEQLAEITTATGVAADSAAGAVDNLAAKFEGLTTFSDTGAAAIAAVADPTNKLQEAFDALVVGFATGAIPMVDLGAAAGALGVEIGDLQAIVDTTAAEIEAFADRAVAALPTVADAVNALGEGISAQGLLDALAEQEAAIRGFNTNVTELMRLGLDEIATLALEQGPLIGGQLAASVLEATPELQAALEGQIVTHAEATEELSRNAEVWGAGWVREHGEIATDATSELREKLKLEETARVAAAGATSAILGSQGAMRVAGSSAGKAGADGLQFGIGPMSSHASNAARGAVAAVDATAGALGQAGRRGGDAASFSFKGGIDLMPGFASSATIRTKSAIDSGLSGINAFSKGFGVGSDLGAGIKGGIDAKVGDIARSASNAVFAAFGAAKSAARAGSPSQLFAEGIGEPISEGIAVGIEAAGGDAQRSLSRVLGMLAATEAPTVGVGTSGGGFVAAGTTGALSTSATTIAVTVNASFNGATPTRGELQLLGDVVANAVARKRALAVTARRAGTRRTT